MELLPVFSSSHDGHTKKAAAFQCPAQYQSVTYGQIWMIVLLLDNRQHLTPTCPYPRAAVCDTGMSVRSRAQTEVVLLFSDCGCEMQYDMNKVVL